MRCSFQSQRENSPFLSYAEVYETFNLKIKIEIKYKNKIRKKSKIHVARNVFNYASKMQMIPTLISNVS